MKRATALAEVLDGTSPMYVGSPVADGSVIGKCGICRAQIQCEVTDETVLCVTTDEANCEEA